jgi:predicted SnoaL-like aldol condensation-catalyzing enzyme
MSTQTDLLRELTARFNERKPIEIERYFTPDFELDDPGSGARRSGHDGARAMANALAGLGESVRIEILHMIEQDDCVAVRYAVRSEGADPRIGAMIAFYRFVDGRIAEDWGVSTPAPWRR